MHGKRMRVAIADRDCFRYRAGFVYLSRIRNIKTKLEQSMTSKTMLNGLISLLVLGFMASTPATAESGHGDGADHSSHSKPHHKSKEEREKMREKRHERKKRMAEKRLQEIDQNGDEMVDLNEYLAHAEARFKKLDADGNGLVTREEARMRHRELRKKHSAERKHKKGHSKEGESRDSESEDGDDA